MSVQSGTAATPAELFGPLFAAVQGRGILSDGKTFVDAVPRGPIAAIMAEFAELSRDDDELRNFVSTNFDLPSEPEFVAGKSPAPLRDYIRAMWPALARDPQPAVVNSSALPVGHHHVVPGGRFREIYYWDSFFTMLGLIRDGQQALANGIVETMTDLIEAHGHVPNGTRTYYVGRSQPPLFHMMVALLDDRRPGVVARRLAAMKREHAWWMAGADTLAPGECGGRVVRLADGLSLNRYWDERSTPRDESWREDVETASNSSRLPEQVYRDLRAGAESGWDFSSRWLDGELASIRTTTIAPVDLNAFLYGLERAIADAGDLDSGRYADHAARRREAMNAHLWNGREGGFGDGDLRDGGIRPNLTAAALAPLLTGVASQAQADATARVVRETLLAPGGLRTTLARSGQQWDSPNGWAPLQWIAVTGLRRYGFDDLADDVAARWVDTVKQVYARTGLLFEKYDVETPSMGGGGEYAPQVGFGWTNGVTADFIDQGLERSSA